MLSLQDLLRGLQGQLQTGTGFGGHLGRGLGIPVQRQAAQLPTVTGGNGGGIVPTPEQIAESEAAARYFGVEGVEAQDDPIVVNARRRQLPPPPPEPSEYETPPGTDFDLRNTSMVESALKVQKENDKLHKGMFGIKGTLRDVLGLVGDSFLVNAGKDRVYAPRRQQERESDALTGFTQSPLAAIERMTQANPELASDINTAYGNQQLRQAQQESLAASREDIAATRNQGRFEKARAYTAALLNAAGGDPAKIAYALQQAAKAAEAAGVSLEDLGIEDGMTPEQLQVYSDAGMTVNQQESWPRRDRQLDQGDRRAATGEQNAQTARIRANRPPAGRAPRAETADEKFIRLSDKPNPTKGEREWLETRRNRGESSGRPRPSRPNGTRPPIRIRSVRDK